ncbi:MAG: polyribonucleotide nucleotidyltransferase [Candidatus Omnitrophica bacterium]|nr:polyribonucleotide nucleotidyltransferase [Candidatus Omnitrophota bacterium]
MTEKININLEGKELIIETGKMAKQADGAVTVQMGGTVVLVTAVLSKKPRENADFLPLFVEYQERTYAAGKIPGGFFKREGRPSEKAILTARLIDRPVRPLFPNLMTNEIQIIAVVLSSDGENDSDVLSMIGASAALSISDIPFDGPIGSVRIGRIDNKFVLNPTFQELENSDLDLVIAGKNDKILMIESSCQELEESTIIEAIKFAQGFLKPIIEIQEKLTAKCGRKKRENISLLSVSEELMSKIKKEASAKLNEIILLKLKDQREDAFDVLCKEMAAKYITEEDSYTELDLKMALGKLEKDIVRDYTLTKGKRVDKRSYVDIRPIECSVGVLPRTHGSGLFTRGQTQSLSVATLGTSTDEQRIDALEGETQKSFMLHYNFPPFSVGEIKPVRGPGRREIGHGALAEKSLKAVMPSSEKFPYTVRVVSDILESNGSSSMASACAGSLSLMDAGVPIKAPVAGIAIGLVTDGKNRVMLTDIAGVEDHYGDMDFKVAGTTKGITAIQLDMKIAGIGMDVVKDSLAQAKDARLKVLEIMTKIIAKPKEAVSEYAPRIVNIKVKQDKIKDIIGPGGKVIKKIIQDTGVSIDVDDDGNVQVASADNEALEKAVAIINGITAEAEVGRIYKGKITRIMNFGAFCQILPTKEGLIHVSELADKFIKNVEDVVKVGDEVSVKVIEVDEKNRINLSMKQAKAKDEQ